MTENAPEGTTAEDLAAGGEKPGGDYGDVSGTGTADGPATPDEPEAQRAQEGVQESFS
jgi:hypothetical protein